MRESMSSGSVRTTGETPGAGIGAREKQAVALSSIAAAALLAGLKATMGLVTGSLGILSEAAHSGLDLVAAVITYVSVRAADKPADRAHPFGHGKIENLSAFFQTVLLVVTSVWIVSEAGRRLLAHGTRVEPSVWAFGVMFLSVTLDTLRARALFRAARKYNSQALEADALHFSTDTYSSSVVILGLVLVVIAHQSRFAWLQAADPLAALIVAGLTLYVSLRLGNRAVGALLDAAPEGAPERIARAVAVVPGVVNPGHIRVRQSGTRVFVDMRPILESTIPFARAQLVVSDVKSAIRRLYPAADVLVDAASVSPASSDVVERVRLVAHRQNHEIHNVIALGVDGRVHIHLDLELDPGLRLDEAHDRATRLEQAIREELPEVGGVTVHIEPRRGQVVGATRPSRLQRDMERRLLALARKVPGILDCHAVEARETGGHVLVTVHCTLQPGLTVERVHEITEDLELRFRREFHQVFKVGIHAEPGSETAAGA